MKFLRRVSLTNIIAGLLFLFSIATLSVALYMNLNIHVIKNWRLVLPAGAIHEGDTVVIQSLYTKTMNVSGTSTRYIECKTTKGLYVRYPISQAVANRAGGSGGTGIPMVIPRSIPDVPTTCKITVSIDYSIYLWRHVIETNSSQEFRLLPSETSPVASQTPATVQDHSFASSSNNTANTNSSQSNTSQPTNTAPKPPQSTGVLGGLLNTINSVLGGYK